MPDANFHVEQLICNESFQQFCLGTSFENELLWLDWIDKLPHKRKEFEEAKRLVEILNVKQGSRLQQLQELKSGLQQKALLTSAINLDSRNKKLPMLNKVHPLYRYIGSVAALILVALFIYIYNPRPSSTTVKHQPKNQFSSGTSMRKTMVLPDGTVITLAKESSINLPGDFNKNNRELWLSGEAFFDVKHDAQHPFIVHTAFNDIKVLGTAFNVKAYPNAKEMETSLIRGSIRVESKIFSGQFVFLKPNEKLTTNTHFSKDDTAALKPFTVTSLIKASDNSQIQEVLWVKNRIEIEDEPLSVIVKKLQNWYGIEIVITDATVANYHYSGVFENESVVKTLEALQLSYPFHLEVEQNKITISK